MLELGTKFRILNEDSTFKVYDATGATERTTAASIIATDVVSLTGYHSNLPLNKMHSMRLLRAQEYQNVSATYTVIPPAGIQVGDILELLIKVTHRSYDSNLQNEFIDGDRTITVATGPIASTTPEGIIDALIAVSGDYTRFGNANLFEYIKASATTLTIKSVYTQDFGALKIKAVGVRQATIAVISPPIIELAIVASATTEPRVGRGFGREMEARIKCNTFANLDQYGVDTGHEARLSEYYTVWYFQLDSTLVHPVGNGGVGTAPANTTSGFEVYFNETSLLTGANSVIAKVAAIAAAHGNFVPGTDGDPDSSDPLSNTLVTSEDLVADSAANFLA